MKNLFCMLAVVAGLGACGKKPAPAPVSVQTTTLAIGAQAPDFRLTGTDGREWTLGDFKEKQALCVVFIANHCPTSQFYEDRLKSIVNDYAGKGVGLVAISPNSPKGLRIDELAFSELGDSLEDMKVRAKTKGYNFPYLYDGDVQAVSKAYGPVSTPHAFVFDKERKLRYVGRVDDNEIIDRVKTNDLRNALDAVLAGKTPNPEKTKAYGCSVKWAEYAPDVVQFMEKLSNEPVTVGPIDAAGIAKLRVADGKVRLINVWASWCAPCVKEFPALIEISRMFRDRNFEVVTIAAQNPEEQDQVLKFLKKQQSSGRNFLMASADKAPILEAVDKEWSGALPFTLLLDAKGEVIFRKEGIFDSADLKKRVLDALGREMIIPAEHR
jgi:peroxiredoxin